MFAGISAVFIKLFMVVGIITGFSSICVVELVDGGIYVGCVITGTTVFVVRFIIIDIFFSNIQYIIG
jgi:hypothetical protein